MIRRKIQFNNIFEEFYDTKAILAFLLAYSLVAILAGAIIAHIINQIGPSKADILDQILTIAILALFAIPASVLFTWPAIFLGLLMRIALYRRNIDRW